MGAGTTAVAVLSLLLGLGQALPPSRLHAGPRGSWTKSDCLSGDVEFSTVAGFFLQDLNTTDPSTFDYTKNNFGLVNRTYPSDPRSHGGSASSMSWGHGQRLTQWQLFARYVDMVNHHAPENVNYKVLFLGRHGEGNHNAAETFYGTPAWNCYWAEIDGNATVTWADAHLDQAGIQQAQVAHDFWAHEIAVEKIPVPNSYYVSPLSRCLETANVTFAGLDLPRGAAPFVPEVKELLREGISIHTCDRRSSKDYIHASFPTWRIEPGFIEQDPLWNGVTAETASAQDARSLKALREIFTQEQTGTWVSVTSHSGEIASMLRVLGHIPFSLNTGAVIPVLVRAEVPATKPAPVTTQAWTASAHCTSPPVTSISNGACVCANSAMPVTSTLSGSGPIHTGST